MGDRLCAPFWSPAEFAAGLMLAAVLVRFRINNCSPDSRYTWHTRLFRSSAEYLISVVRQNFFFWVSGKTLIPQKGWLKIPLVSTWPLRNFAWLQIGHIAAWPHPTDLILLKKYSLLKNVLPHSICWKTWKKKGSWNYEDNNWSLQLERDSDWNSLSMFNQFRLKS